MDWLDDLTVNDWVAIYFSGLIIVSIICFALRQYVPGIAGKLLAFLFFVGVLFVFERTFTGQFGNNYDTTGGRPVSGVADASSETPTPASAEPERDYNAPVPASGHGE